ncbi:MAG TPA: MaoC family dehydratase N-terminal domain-containing protein [Allosphingosinicella sp.]|jgi:acyl dehydratase
MSAAFEENAAPADNANGDAGEPASADALSDSGRRERRERMKRLVARSARLVGAPPADIEAGARAADWLSISRHVAATGDDNPLYLDPAYGATSWWGTQLAPPGFVLSIMVPESVGALYEERYDAVERLSRIELWWNDHIKLGDRVDAKANLVHACLKEPEGGGACAEIVTQVCYRSERRRVAAARGHVLVQPLDLGRELLVDRAMHRYEPEDIERIEAALEAEAPPRGQLPRYHCEVRVGEALPTTLRGPITWSELQSWMVAEGKPAPAGNLRHRALEAQPGNLRAHKATGWPVSDRRQGREDLLACADVGFPAPSARGAMAAALAIQLVTGWMGDDAFLRHLSATLLAPALYGDTLALDGRIADKFEQSIGDRTYFAARLDLEIRNQLGQAVLEGSALVYLPEKGRPVELPVEEEMF